MAEAEIHGLQSRINVQCRENSLKVVRGTVPLFKRGTIFLYQGSQFFGSQRIKRIPGRDLDKDFVNKADVAESELVGSRRTGEELDDVFLILEFGAEPPKDSRRSYQEDV
jgi:hypothetical protein